MLGLMSIALSLVSVLDKLMIEEVACADVLDRAVKMKELKQLIDKIHQPD